MSWLSENLGWVAPVAGAGIGALAGGAPGAAVGLGVGAAVGSGAFAGSAQDKANEMNREEAQKNRDFQERMSNTAYQRGVADLRKAGINPLLAAGGGGASSPSGSTAAPAQAADGINEGVQVAGKALETYLAKQAVAKSAKEIEVLDSQIDHLREQDLNLATERITERQTQKAIELANKARAAELPAVSARAQAEKAAATIDAKMAVPDAIIGRFGAAAGALGNALGGGRIIQGMSNSATMMKQRNRALDMKEHQILQRGGRKGMKVHD